MFAAKLILLAGVVVLAVAPAGLAPAQPASSSASVIDGPISPRGADWVRLPTGDELARLYPSGARRNGVSGIARLHCKVTLAATIGDCVVVSESPAGYGFGQAALALASSFRLRQATYGPNASIDIPIRFNIG